MTTAAMRRANVLTIAPGVPFLRTFVDALLDGRIVPALSRASGPLALARTTIYVPTRRARRALVTAFAEAADGATLLPRIAALGALDEEAGDDESGIGDASDVPPAIGDLERRLLLTDLVLAWTRALPGAIVAAAQTGFDTHPDKSLVVGTSPADAFALAGDLAGLIDEFTIEGIDPARLRELADAEHDRYWQITTRFLDIAFELWPKILAERGSIDAALRRVHLARMEAARLTAHAPHDPVIVLGSTGTNEATARLMAAICRLPNGAVVLPGLDTAMPDDVFAHVARAGDEAEESAFGHPQAALKRLLSTLGLSRDAVTDLAPSGMNARLRLVSEAMRPAETTDAWPHVRGGFGGSFADALENVALLEAADEREEALAIAIRFREILETPGKTAALVTPDRTLARRVRAELKRWTIDVDDSAGEPLGATAAGSLARLVLQAAFENTDAATLALLAHGATRLGRPHDDVQRLTRLFEAGLCRATTNSGADTATRVADVRRGDRHSHPFARAIREADWIAIVALIEDVQSALAPLSSLREATLDCWISAHRDSVARLTDVLDGEDAETLFALFEEPSLAGNARLELDAGGYSAFFDRLAQAEIVRGPRDAHPRLKILGLLEARLLQADLVVLGGLDETIWPPAAQTSAFLNRPMRATLGLTPPERRIGQTAHDLWMAMGAPEVMLTRARKRDRAPTTPSRFLQRLSALVGDDMAALRQRGERYAALARSLDAPAATERLKAPAPKPPIDLRPTKLSVTRIETWIRDPYAIYAERILRLQALGTLDEDPGAAEQGTAIHKAIEAFTKEHAGALPADARERLLAHADRWLAAFHDDPVWRAFRHPRLIDGLDFFLGYDHERRPALSALVVEIKGTLVLTLDDGSTFTLTGEADRIEIAKDGAIRIVDFKTGAPPSSSQIAADLAPQLTLEAAMVAAGAFDGVPARAVDEGLYLRLGGKEGGTSQFVETRDATFSDLVARHREKLAKLVNDYRNPAQAYASRPMAEFASKYSDYDHLARVKEWSATGGEGEEP